MHTKCLFAAMLLGAAVGAIAILMVPGTNPARKLAMQAASKVEDAACKVGNKITQAMEP